MDVELQTVEKLKQFKKLKNAITLGFFIEILLALFAGIFSDANSQSLNISAVLFLLGTLLFIWTLLYDKPPTHADRLFGPWKITRHPVLFAAIIFNLVNLLAARHAFIFAVSIVFLSLIYRRRFERDEKKINRRFDSTAARYRIEVAGLFPSLSSLVEPSIHTS